jgi:protein RecA
MIKTTTARRTAAQLMAEVNAAFGPGTVMMGSDPYFEVTYLPTGVAPVDDLLEGGLPFGRFVEIFGDYCVTPDTKILTDALSWAPAGELLPDYGLVGFDEELNQGRGRTATLKPSQVEHLGYKKLDCIRVVTDRGEITCSRGHGFVARNRCTGSREWRSARELLVGDELAWTTEPWDLLTSRDAGYAAGILDGEGWLDGKRVSFGQLPGLVLDEGIATLKRLGFDTTVTMQGNGVYRVAVTGGMYQTMRALGQLRPVRLLHQAVPIWSGRGMVSKGPFTEEGKTIAHVLAVEEVGKQDVVTMQTSSRTFIANGFPSHNSTLKSYIGLCAIRECQRLGKLAALIDTEHAYDPKWAADIGVDTKELILRQPETAEAAIDLAEALIRGGVDLIVFDSVAASLPQQEQQKKMDKENPPVAALARVMSLAMRKLTASNKKTAMLWINQTRVNVGVMFGSNEAVPGGKALPFYASYRIAFRKGGRVTEDKQVTVFEKGKPVKKNIKLTVAQTIRATKEKSKLNAPHRDVTFDFDFRMAKVDDWKYLVLKCLEEGVLSLDKGRWWLTDDPTTKFRGLDVLRKAMNENDLRILLGGQLTPVASVSRGSRRVVKKKDVSQKSAKQKRSGQGSTRTQVQGKSKTMRRTVKRSTR